MESRISSSGGELDCEQILDLAIEYKVNGTYPDGLSKDKKRAITKRAQSISIVNGEAFLQKKKGRVSEKLQINLTFEWLQ
jgi:hypothetical protein